MGTIYLENAKKYDQETQSWCVDGRVGLKKMVTVLMELGREFELTCHDLAVLYYDLHWDVFVRTGYFQRVPLSGKLATGIDAAPGLTDLRTHGPVARQGINTALYYAGLNTKELDQLNSDLRCQSMREIVRDKIKIYKEFSDPQSRFNLIDRELEKLRATGLAPD